MQTAVEMLPKETKEVKILENGRSARGRAPCPICGQICKVTACSDVNGVWFYCLKCGLIDV